MSVQKKDELLDHDADGIQEYDNDLPRWWLYGFYFTILCAMLYAFYYHVYTGPDWNVLWYRQRGQVAEYQHSVSEAKITLASAGASSSGASSSASGDAVKYALKTDEAALKRGEEIYNGNANLCFTCHRQDLGGVVGPNLTDEYWIHGGSFKSLVKSIRTGFPDKGMMAYGSNARLSDDDLINLASYIISRKGTNPPDPKPIDPAREKIFTEADAAKEEAVAETEAERETDATAVAPGAAPVAEPIRRAEVKRQIDPKYAGWPRSVRVTVGTER
jgi:cytochrome c oxidase cbb3-type subunit 3